MDEIQNRIFTPEYRIVGEFITLGTLYNDMGIDCMEINDIQITPDRERLQRLGGGIVWIKPRGFVCFTEKFNFAPFSIPNVCRGKCKYSFC